MGSSVDEISIGSTTHTQKDVDIAAPSLNARMFMPELVEPHRGIPIDKVTPKTDQGRQYLQEWRGGAANDPRMPRMKDEGFQPAGVVGSCWSTTFDRSHHTLRLCLVLVSSVLCA